MRVSDAERERVAEFIREQALEGRLDSEELEERLGLAYSAKTAGELEDLIADLPHRLVSRRAKPPTRQQKHPPLPAIVGLVVLGVIALPTLAAGGIAIATALIVALVATVFALSVVFGPFVLVGVLVAQAARRRRPQPRRRQHWSPHY